MDKDTVIERLKEEAEQIDKDFLAKKDVGYKLGYQAEKQFGSWNKAKNAAGLKTIKQKYTKKELVGRMQELAKELGRSPKADDDHTLKNIVVRKFGSWNKGKKAAGLETYPRGFPGSNITDEKLVDLVRKLQPASAKKVADKLPIDTVAWRLQSISVIERVKVYFGRSGSTKKATEIINPLDTWTYYYVDKESLIDFMENKVLSVELKPTMNKHLKKKVTSYLTRKVPKKVFEYLRKKYTKDWDK